MEAVLSRGTEAGMTLPEELSKALGVERVIDENITKVQQDRAAVQPAALRESLTEELLSAARTGKLPESFGQTIMTAEAEQRRLDLALAVLEGAYERAMAEIRRAMGRDRLIVEHMRPVFEAILEGARKLAPVLAGVTVDDAEVLLAASPKVREAGLQLRALRQRFDNLFAARRSLLNVMGGPQRDDGTFELLRDPQRAWGDSWNGRLVSRSRPWPSQPLAYLLW
ncbi:MAG: hypothetical protein M3386_05355, partial [Actinomycetota bacterium]|nr:hypothetical protein [Actinomycetota bacterium]